MPREPFPFRCVAPYQPERVNAKVAFNNGQAKVIALALQSGQRLNEHKTSTDTFLLVTEGEIRFAIEGSELTLSQGDAFEIPANVPHAVTAVGDSRLLLVH